MSIESGIQFTPEKPKVSETERDLNEIIPILAHGLVRRIEQKGFSGKVRVQALAGDTWGVAKSHDNSTDIPNVIIYPRESLSGDRRLVNARLRHEIGNLNYPIDSEINALRGWCYENKIAPELLTSLVEATHEASVNYLEMQNSHSDTPQENFRALYEQEINTQQIADGVAQSAPYKQAVDLTLLYSLSQTGLVPAEQFEHALGSAHPAVQEIFDKQTRSVLDQSVKMAVPKKQVQLVRDFLWPKFSKLVALSGPSQAESKDSEVHDKKAEALLEELKGEKNPEASARAQQAKEIQEKMQKLMEKMKQKPQNKSGKKPSQESKKEAQKESKKPQQQELSSAEKQERKEEENLLAKNLQEQLERAKEQLEKLQKPGQQPEAQKPQEKSSMQDIGKQAEQMKQQAEKAMQEAKEAGTQDEITEEELQKLKEQLEQLEEVAKQIAESGALEEELAKPEEEPITYNIKEYGINEADLTPEQLEHLQKIRSFAQGTSKVYRTVMRLLMTGYQQHNPKFTDKMMQKMMERSYDVPDFSIYGSQAAQEFLSRQPELGIDGFSDNFLVNFQLPKPLARFWYKGGSGSKSQPVKEGEIEWGHFYRMAMPVIYSGVDRAGMSGLYLNRLNGFGQHDPKKYYYLYEAINAALEDQVNKSDESESEDSEQGEGEDQGSESESGEFGEGQESESGESGSESGQGQGQGEGAGEGEQPGGEGDGEPGGSESGGGGTPSAQEMQEMLSQMQDMLNQAKEQGGDGGAPGAGQEAMDQLLEQIAQMQQSIESGGSPQDMAGQMQEAMQQLSEMMEGMQGGQESPLEHPDPRLLQELQELEKSIGSQFTQQTEDGEYSPITVDADTLDFGKEEKFDPTETVAWRDAFGIRGESAGTKDIKFEGAQVIYGQPRAIEYENFSEKEVQGRYEEYEKEVQELTDNVVDFFKRNLYLDHDRQYTKNQRRGARIQRGWQRNIMSVKDRKVLIRPDSLERRLPPEKANISWSIILDNSLSCAGETFEQEKKFVVAMTEAARELDIPIEVVTFTGMDPKFYTHIKTFSENNQGEFVSKLIKLKANQSTWDSEVLDDIVKKFDAEKNNEEARRFVFSLTDGFHSVCVHCDGAGGCSDPYHPESDPHKPDKLTKDIIREHDKDVVLMGIGFNDAAKLIKITWGENGLEAPNPDSRQFSEKFLQELEEKMDKTFH